jgi:hypothetical protein
MILARTISLCACPHPLPSPVEPAEGEVAREGALWHAPHKFNTFNTFNIFANINVARDYPPLGHHQSPRARTWRSYQSVEENPMSPHFRVPRRRGQRVLLAA